ncbi:MAG: hypothetical protein ACYCO3_11905 [Mycobacteriales bacterium]
MTIAMPEQTSQQYAERALEVAGVAFVLRLFADPSGLRGQVFYGEEKIAGVQLFHSTDVSRLLWLARRDRAVLAAAQRLANRGD